MPSVDNEITSALPRKCRRSQRRKASLKGCSARMKTRPRIKLWIKMGIRIKNGRRRGLKNIALPENQNKP